MGSCERVRLAARLLSSHKGRTDQGPWGGRCPRLAALHGPAGESRDRCRPPRAQRALGHRGKGRTPGGEEPAEATQCHGLICGGKLRPGKKKGLV